MVKTSNWESAIKHTSLVSEIHCIPFLLMFVKCLKIQPDNAKALYRRGMAYSGNNNLLKAEEDLQKAYLLAGNGKQKPFLTIVYNCFTRSEHQTAISIG